LGIKPAKNLLKEQKEQLQTDKKADITEEM
jgi:hypothetical protein